jgi:hypothetical protein
VSYGSAPPDAVIQAIGNPATALLSSATSAVKQQPLFGPAWLAILSVRTVPDSG